MNCLHSVYEETVIQRSHINNVSHLPAFLWIEHKARGKSTQLHRDSSGLMADLWSWAAGRQHLSSCTSTPRHLTFTWSFPSLHLALIRGWFYLISCWIFTRIFVSLLWVPDLFLLLKQVWRLHLELAAPCQGSRLKCHLLNCLWLNQSLLMVA